MKSVIYQSCFLWFFWATPAVAEFFETPMLKANWEAKTSKTECELIHPISNYGTSGFRVEGNHPLEFYLKPRRFHSPIVEASLSDRASAWMHGRDFHQNYSVSLETAVGSKKIPRLAVSGGVAEQMFESLSRGRVPTFVYRRSAREVIGSETRVAVSSINFLAAYEKFVSCRENILPIAISDIQDRVLYFEYKSKNPDQRVVGFFNEIKQYLKAVGGGNVLIGSEIAAVEKEISLGWFNKRFESISSQLAQAGINKKQINKRHRLPLSGGKNSIRIHLFGPEVLKTYYYRGKETRLSKKHKRRLIQLASYHKDYFNFGKLIINAHTDSSGSRSANKLVSDKRAREIKNFLQDRGVDSDRIVIRSHGERKPRFSNRSRSGKAKNSRVVIDFIT